MQNKKLYKAESKKEWYTTGNISTEQLQLGAIMRIADATEKIAQNYSSLIEERDRYKRWYNEGSEERRRLERRISSLKGVITKIKKR